MGEWCEGRCAWLGFRRYSPLTPSRLADLTLPPLPPSPFLSFPSILVTLSQLCIVPPTYPLPSIPFSFSFVLRLLLSLPSAYSLIYFLCLASSFTFPLKTTVHFLTDSFHHPSKVLFFLQYFFTVLLLFAVSTSPIPYPPFSFFPLPFCLTFFPIIQADTTP